MKKKRYFMHSTISALPKGHKYRNDIARGLKAHRKSKERKRELSRKKYYGR